MRVSMEMETFRCFAMKCCAHCRKARNRGQRITRHCAVMAMQGAFNGLKGQRRAKAARMAAWTEWASLKDARGGHQYHIGPGSGLAQTAP